MAEKCVLLSGTFASLVQLSLAAIALATLLYKRHLERPRRPWLVWTLDVSKQGLGALYAHVLNIFIAEGLHSRGGTASDECEWYFVNYIVDSGFGVLMALLMLAGLIWLAQRAHWPSLQNTGEYGSPPSWWIWGVQLTAWMLILTIAKVILGMGVVVLSDPLGTFMSWLFAPLEGSPRFKLVLVMVLLPCALNTLQFWIQDNFLMSHAAERRAALCRCMCRAREYEPLDHNRRKHSLALEEEGDMEADFPAAAGHGVQLVTPLQTRSEADMEEDADDERSDAGSSHGHRSSSATSVPRSASL